jgi:uncharacterized protein YcsI (UPF0317 family)
MRDDVTSIMPRVNPGREARRAIRSGAHTTHTAGLAPGYVQGNLCILPSEYAADFLLFCERNPKPCPLIGVSEPGDPTDVHEDEVPLFWACGILA